MKSSSVRKCTQLLNFLLLSIFLSRQQVSCRWCLGSSRYVSFATPNYSMSDRPLDGPAGDKMPRDSRRNSLSLPNPWENYQVAPESHDEGTSVGVMEGDVKAKVNYGSTPFHEAAWRRDDIYLPPVLVEYSVNAMAMANDKDVPPPLYFAAQEEGYGYGVAVWV